MMNFFRSNFKIYDDTNKKTVSYDSVNKDDEDEDDGDEDDEDEDEDDEDEDEDDEDEDDEDEDDEETTVGDTLFRYKYINKEDNHLSQFFGDFIDTDKSYNIFVCIYKMNVDCKLPFLEFLIDNNQSFPIINNFVCREGDNEEQNVDFKNKCILEVLNRIKIDDIFGVELLEKMFKGFLKYNDDDIFVVFECPDYNRSISKDSKWSILAEIIDDQTNDFDPIVKSFFIDNKFMTEIRNENDDVIPTPILLYLCTDANIQSQSIVDTTMKHDWLGDYYCFVSKPIDTNTQKYAVFTENVKYILVDISTINEKQINDFLNDSTESVVLTIYYHQNNIQYWGIKNNNNFTRI